MNEGSAAPNMPKIQLNSALDSVTGTMDGWVYKHYHKDKRGRVLSRKPDMSRVKPTAAQRTQRDRMRQAGEFHRTVLADPALRRKYERLARKQRINLSAATMGAFLRGEQA